MGVQARQPSPGASALNGAAFISAVSYLPFGPVNQISFANGKTLTKSYDQNYDIDAIVSTATGGLNLDYSVDEVGNIVGVNQSGTQFNLSYDKLYRLSSCSRPNSNRTVSQIIGHTKWRISALVYQVASYRQRYLPIIVIAT